MCKLLHILKDIYIITSNSSSFCSLMQFLLTLKDVIPAND